MRMMLGKEYGDDGCGKVERAWHESEERYRLLVEHSPDTIAVHAEGRFVFINRAGVDLFGAAYPEDLIGRPLLDFIHPDTIDVAERRIARSYQNQGRAGRIEEKLIHLNGRIIDAEISTIPVMYEGRPATQVIIRDVTARKEMERMLYEANEKLRKLSMMDGLTGISNRRCFDESLTDEWQTALSLLLIDIDCFKAYNDTYGHLQGDECLRQVAKALEDALPDCLVARYGGEEFAVLLPDTKRIEAFSCAQQLCCRIASLRIEHISSTVDACITASIGAATMYPVRADDKVLLIDGADQALYKAKQQGRNQAISTEGATSLLSKMEREG